MYSGDSPCFHPSKEVFEVSRECTGPSRRCSFHPSKEVFEAPGTFFAVFVLLGFHPSKEVFEAEALVRIEALEKRFHPSKEVFEAQGLPALGQVLQVSIPLRKFLRRRRSNGLSRSWMFPSL